MGKRFELVRFDSCAYRFFMSLSLVLMKLSSAFVLSLGVSFTGFLLYAGKVTKLFIVARDSSHSAYSFSQA